MGCDIHSFAEVRNKKTGKWEMAGDCFDDRNYSVFGFLADVNNYSQCEPLSQPKGLPADVSKGVRQEYKIWEIDGHSSSYLTLKEFVEFDYDKTFWNRRITKQVAPNVWDGAALAEEGEGRVITYREHLGSQFFKHLAELKTLGNPEDVRIVFWFDN